MGHRLPRCLQISYVILMGVLLLLHGVGYQHQHPTTPQPPHTHTHTNARTRLPTAEPQNRSTTEPNRPPLRYASNTPHRTACRYRPTTIAPHARLHDRTTCSQRYPPPPPPLPVLRSVDCDWTDDCMFSAGACAALCGATDRHPLTLSPFVLACFFSFFL